MMKWYIPLIAVIWSTQGFTAEAKLNGLASSQDIPANHPLANMSSADLKARMRESHMANVSAQLEAYSDPESIQLIAKFSHNLFRALVDEGFNEEQALEIVKSIGLPNRR